MKKLLPVLALFFLIACGEEAEEGPIYQVNGVALDGYDPVSYLEQGVARKGLQEVALNYKGVKYLFNSTKNKDLFKADPQKYSPAYGGWCAYAIANNSTLMAPDPELFKVQDGKLLMFYDDFSSVFTGTLLKEWETDSINYYKKANQNWRQLDLK